MQYRPFMVRWFTQDIIAANEVIGANQYALPDKFSDEDTIIDIGAHIGCFAVECLNRGAGKVLCYEPAAENFLILKNNMSPWKARCEVNFNAVWSKRGWLKVNDPPKPGMTAMYHTLFGEGQDVLGVTLDEILAKVNSVRLLKIDCEGAELPILNAVTNLDKVKGITGEIHYKMPVVGGPTNHWLRNRLGELGFHYVKISVGDRDPDHIGMFWAFRK